MPETKARILWVDDEVDSFKPHVMILEQRGYHLTLLSNGADAIDWVATNTVDLVLLDEQMPGMGGLETLQRIKEIAPALPIVMVTKNEEESIMEEAIGGKISDYLTKPVNPSQILLVIKKFLEGKQIVRDKTSQDYIQDFNSISRLLLSPMDLAEWTDLYRRMVEWDMELDQHPELGLAQTMTDQRRECNQEFCKYFERNYRDFIEDPRVVLSPDVFRTFVEPHLASSPTVFFFVIDCMRYDQWLVMEQHLQEYFTITRDFHLGIIPSATPYARNAIFSGYHPGDIAKVMPEMWATNDDDDNSMNRFEKELLERQLERRRIKLRTDLKYIKILDSEFGRQMVGNIDSFTKNHLTAIVVNFVDMLAHSRSDYPILKEIAPDEAAYRSLTNSWFQHSSLFAMFRQLARHPQAKIVITTDHGSMRCLRGSRVQGDRETSTNLRYKYGRNVKVDDRHAMQIRNPLDYKLPHRGAIVNYVIAKEDYYFVYPTEYNRYLAYYRDSFQHGGISLEELMLPVITMMPKG